MGRPCAAAFSVTPGWAQIYSVFLTPSVPFWGASLSLQLLCRRPGSGYSPPLWSSAFSSLLCGESALLYPSPALWRAVGQGPSWLQHK